MSLWMLMLVGLALVGVALASALDDAWRAQPRARLTQTSGRRSRRPVALASAVGSRRAFLGWLGGASLVALLTGCGYLGRPLSSGASPAPTQRPTEPSPPAPLSGARATPVAEVGDLATPAVAPASSAEATGPATGLASTPTPEPSPVATLPPRRRQPNVLLITVDSARADRVGASGFAQAQTPTLDRLAAEGTRFAQAICQLPQTNSSHAALLTGLYPSTNGVKVHMVDKVRSGSQTLASVFAGSGYRTAGIYSWVSLDPQFCGLDQGFQTYQGYIVNRNGVFANQQLEGLAAVYRQLKDKVSVVKTVDAALGQSDRYEETMDGRADVTTAAALAWLDGYTASDPFFLWLHYFDPHYAYSPPAPYDRVQGLQYSGTIDGSVDTIHKLQQGQLQPAGTDLARLLELYQGEVAFADAQIGGFLDALRQRGLEDDTIVVVVGDHGESFGEHDEWTHGWKIYQSAVQVPLIVRYPSVIPAGRVIDAPAQLIDVMPTLLDLAGLKAPQPVQGSSLLPLLTGRDDGSDRYAFVEVADEAFVSLITPGWKLIRNNANGELQLYNLREDPTELSNLAQSEQAKAGELNTRLGDLMKLSGVTR